MTAAATPEAGYVFIVQHDMNFEAQSNCAQSNTWMIPNDNTDSCGVGKYSA